MILELSVVVPVYKEEDNISEFLQRIVPILNGSLNDFEIIFVLDPSPDRTEEIILAHHVEDKRIKLLKSSRRFGQPMAILAGLSRSSGLAVVVIDVDLQDPPELIPQMVVKWKEGYDVVYAHTGEYRGISTHEPSRCRGTEQTPGNPRIPAGNGSHSGIQANRNSV